MLQNVPLRWKIYMSMVSIYHYKLNTPGHINIYMHCNAYIQNNLTIIIRLNRDYNPIGINSAKWTRHRLFMKHHNRQDTINVAMLCTDTSNNVKLHPCIAASMTGTALANESGEKKVSLAGHISCVSVTVRSYLLREWASDKIIPLHVLCHLWFSHLGFFETFPVAGRELHVLSEISMADFWVCRVWILPP